jgi:hypothetical protein
MRTNWQRLLIIGVLSAGLVRCFSSSSGGGTTCNAFVQAESSSACGTCLQSKCASQIASAASPCSDFVSCVCGSGGSSDSCAAKLQEASCQPASQALAMCAQESCPSLCVAEAGSMDSGIDASHDSGQHDATVESGADSSGVDDGSGGDASTMDAPVTETGGGDSAAEAGCPNNETSCSGTCTDTTSDNANCGQCGLACTGGESCLASKCACPTGQTFCGNACTTTSTDAANCGTCGNACPTNQVCAGGSCGVVCLAPSTLCNPTTCTNTGTDTNNCGTCGTVCGPYLNASPGCDLGTCTYSCTGSYLDCSSTSGCETDGQTDRNNCGSCGHACVGACMTCSGGGCVRIPSCG